MPEMTTDTAERRTDLKFGCNNAIAQGGPGNIWLVYLRVNAHSLGKREDERECETLKYS